MLWYSIVRRRESAAQSPPPPPPANWEEKRPGPVVSFGSLSCTHAFCIARRSSSLRYTVTYIPALPPSTASDRTDRTTPCHTVLRHTVFLVLVLSPLVFAMGALFGPGTAARPPSCGRGRWSPGGNAEVGAVVHAVARLILRPDLEH